MLFPPFYCMSGTTEANLGYFFILYPPDMCYGGYQAPIHCKILCTQWVAVLLIGGLLYSIAKDREVYRSL